MPIIPMPSKAEVQIFPVVKLFLCHFDVENFGFRQCQWRHMHLVFLQHNHYFQLFMIVACVAIRKASATNAVEKLRKSPSCLLVGCLAGKLIRIACGRLLKSMHTLYMLMH
jgi:hypothetical protein